jgi:hypothetical protein
LENPGHNRNGKPIRALAMGSQFLRTGSVAGFGVKPRTHHKQKYADVLNCDSSVQSLNNQSRRHTGDLRMNAELYDAFSRILRAFESADFGD